MDQSLHHVFARPQFENWTGQFDVALDHQELCLGMRNASRTCQSSAPANFDGIVAQFGIKQFLVQFVEDVLKFHVGTIKLVGWFFIEINVNC